MSFIHKSKDNHAQGVKDERERISKVLKDYSYDGLLVVHVDYLDELIKGENE